MQLIRIFVSHKDQETDIRMSQLIKEYRAKEVSLVTSAFQKISKARGDIITDEPNLYRAYRRSFARFGGSRKFLTWKEYDELSYEHGLLAGKRKFLSEISLEPSPRERVLKDLLLAAPEYWEDITPPAIPPRPTTFSAPIPASYPAPLHELLKGGWNSDLELVNRKAREWETKNSLLLDLVHMTLDERLLAGWPGEAESWAPFWALHILDVLSFVKAKFY
jgi:hypothetical protein